MKVTGADCGKLWKTAGTLALVIFLSAVCLASPASAGTEGQNEGERFLNMAIKAFEQAATRDLDLNMARAYFYLDKASRAGSPRAHLVLGELMSQRQDLEGKLRAVSLLELYVRNTLNPPPYVLSKIEEIRGLMQKMQETES